MNTATEHLCALRFSAQTREGTKQFQFSTDHLVIAGWVGRDKEALEAHIRELEELGVPRPASTPVFYRVAASLATQQQRVQVIGHHATGEAEVVLFRQDGQDWVTIGSDHTDRKAEMVGVALSKQMCAKPLASEAWLLSECRDHWDQLILRSWIVIDGQRILYQEGPMSSMLQPWELTKTYVSSIEMPQNAMMFCGTLAVHGGIRWSDSFSAELEDPVLKRKLSFSYQLEALPVAG